MSSYEPESRDPGLAAERTDLAWNRSGLSLLALGGVILHGFGRPPLTSGNAAVGVYVLVLGALTFSLQALHGQRARRRRARPTSTADLLPLALGVAAIGVAAFLVAAFAAS